MQLQNTKNRVNNIPDPSKNSTHQNQQAVQFKDNRTESTSQLKVLQMANPVVQKKENKTGMSDQLKSGIEHLSGMDMSDVRVHYNSSKPAQLQAHAYAQGNQIHLASGQEKHLPHEAWHVVQQKQGRVRPTTQLKGKININDDEGLEKEADVMGTKALQMVHQENTQPKSFYRNTRLIQKVTQLVTNATWTTQNFQYNPVPAPGAIPGAPLPVANQMVGRKMVANLDPADNRAGNDTTSHEHPNLYGGLAHYWNPGHTWIRGHLLNAHLGGPNTAPNLFPITNAANTTHSNQVEKYVKTWLRANRPVRYQVIAHQDGGNVGALGVRNAAGSFECYAYTTDALPRQTVNKTIHSTPSLAAAVGPAGPTAGVTRHHNNWWQHNDNNPGNAGAGGDNIDPDQTPGANGGTGPVDFHSHGGMGAGARATWEAGHERAGWFEDYYEL